MLGYVVYKNSGIVTSQLKFIFVVGLFLVLGCDRQSSPVQMEAGYQRISGKTMGTTYNISYLDPAGRNFRISIDSLLNILDNELSTYNAQSFITRFNHSGGKVPIMTEKGVPIAEHFYKNFKRSKEIHELTGGSFDPTVMPLVNYWGFGYIDTSITMVDTLSVDSLKKFVGLDKVNISKGKGLKFLNKADRNVELDFSAIGKGYGVDAVAELLEHFKVKNYMVEIGGEVRVKGKNDKDQLWAIGINTPKAGAPAGDFQAIVELNNIALATSGNYQNFYRVDSLIFSHTINPTTGFPERNSLLSASVFAPDCITADALATACMVMGLPACAETIEREKGIEGYFIYGSLEGKIEVVMTSGTPNYLRKKQ